MHKFNPVAESRKCKELKNLKKKELKVNKLFSSDANSITTEQIVMIKICYDL
jgi:hypothetical protein